jgi:hypothetical protein
MSGELYSEGKSLEDIVPSKRNEDSDTDSDVDIITNDSDCDIITNDSEDEDHEDELEQINTLDVKLTEKEITHKVNHIVFSNLNLLHDGLSYNKFKSLKNKEQLLKDLYFLINNYTTTVRKIFPHITFNIKLIMLYDYCERLSQQNSIIASENILLKQNVKDLETYL